MTPTTLLPTKAITTLSFADLDPNSDPVSKKSAQNMENFHKNRPRDGQCRNITWGQRFPMYKIRVGNIIPV